MVIFNRVWMTWFWDSTKFLIIADCSLIIDSVWLCIDISFSNLESLIKTNSLLILIRVKEKCDDESQRKMQRWEPKKKHGESKKNEEMNMREEKNAEMKRDEKKGGISILS